ncbi:MAG: NAD(P)/FAD-dependent oxidoreductase [Planctomycetaceae bacterium]
MIAISTSCEVPATISADAATRCDWEVIVIGAGPAGAATAWRLGAGGIRVLLVDRHAFPRAKICGCCLSPQAVCELSDLGPDALPAAAIPLESVLLAHGRRSAAVPLPAGRVLSRDALDPHLLRRAIAAGCHWLPGVHVASVADTGTSHALITASTSGESLTLRGEFVVVATGIADHVRVAGHNPCSDDGRTIAAASRIGVGGVLAAESCALPAGRLVMVVGRSGYCGLVRLEDGRIDVAAALDRGAVAEARTMNAALTALLAEAVDAGSCPLPDGAAISAAPLHATPPLTRCAPPVAGRGCRVLRVGDAGRYVEPFTGEGIGWALAAARILAAAMLTPHGLREPAEAAARYRASHHREFAAAHARCRRVAATLRHPAIVAAAIVGARALPWAARLLMPAVIGSTPRGATA